MLKASAVVLLAMSFAFADPNTFRGDPAHSGVYPSPSAPTLQSVKWKFKSGSYVLSSPALDGDSVYFGSSDHNLYALHASNGTVRWKFATGGPIASSPA